MGQIQEQNKRVAVIAQHTVDGSVIPMKLQLIDEDGELQRYSIKSYKVVSCRNYIYSFECKIVVFDNVKIIRLFYNAAHNIWNMTW